MSRALVKGNLVKIRFSTGVCQRAEKPVHVLGPSISSDVRSASSESSSVGFTGPRFYPLRQSEDGLNLGNGSAVN